MRGENAGTPLPPLPPESTMIEMPFAAPLDYQSAHLAPEPLPPRGLWFVMRETRMLVAEPDNALPHHIDLVGPTLRQQYLGTLAGAHCFSAEVAADTDAPAGWRWSDLRSLFGRLDDAVYALAGRAVQLIDWDRTHQFCGRCGTATVVKTSERSRECPSCGLTAYPRLAPALMALIRRMPDEILLARSPRFAPGVHSALAGFAEPGETLEQCLHREVFEEVGLRVRNLRYFASQPWPFPHSLMIAFICDYESGTINPDPNEIESAKWFKLDDLPQLPQPISIARRLIDAAVTEMARSRGA
jgi:NAD+ diphosphatase